MKKSEFPEKIFEILLDHLFLNSGYNIYVPSQRKESKLGYDALFQTRRKKIGIYQYKIVSEFSRIPKYHSSALRAYKFDLHLSKTNGYKQHNLIVKSNLRGINSCYIVPSFVEYKTLYMLYNSGSLKSLPNVKFIYPTMHINDNKYHYITFDEKGAFLQHSHDKIKLESSSFEEFVESVKKSNISFTKEEFSSLIIELLGENNKRNRDKDELAVELMYKSNICLVSFPVK